MEKIKGKTAEQIIIRILSSSKWSKIDKVKLASHEDDLLGIDMHYEWMGMKTQAQIKHMSWWKDIESRRNTYLQLLETQELHPEFDNIRIIVYGFAKTRIHRGSMYKGGLNIYYIKKLEDVWSELLEDAYQRKVMNNEKNKINGN